MILGPIHSELSSGSEVSGEAPNQLFMASRKTGDHMSNCFETYVSNTYSEHTMIAVV